MMSALKTVWMIILGGIGRLMMGIGRVLAPVPTKQSPKPQPEPVNESVKEPKPDFFPTDSCLIVARHSLYNNGNSMIYLIPFDSHSPQHTAAMLRERGIAYRYLKSLSGSPIRYATPQDDQIFTGQSMSTFQFPIYFLNSN
jgi:hypothetical protein